MSELLAATRRKRRKGAGVWGPLSPFHIGHEGDLDYAGCTHEVMFFICFSSLHIGGRTVTVDGQIVTVSRRFWPADLARGWL